MTSVGSILGGAFRLIGRHPASVLVWGLIYLAAMAVLGLAMRPVFLVYSELLSQQLAAGPGQPIDPQQLQPLMMRMQAASGLVFLAEIGLFVLQMVLFTATQRAVLRPEQRGFFYLRLGWDELRLMGLAFFLMVCFSFGFGLAMVILGIFIAIATFASGSAVAAILLFALAGFVLMGAMTYLLVRLSLALPLTFLRGTFVLGESWRLTKGRFWTLFGAYFVIALLQQVLAIMLFILALAPVVSELAGTGNDPEAARLAFQHQFDRIASLDPTMIAVGLGFGLLGGLGLALFGGAMATAARDLTGGPEDGAAPFA